MPFAPSAFPLGIHVRSDKRILEFYFKNAILLTNSHADFYLERYRIHRHLRRALFFDVAGRRVCKARSLSAVYSAPGKQVRMDQIHLHHALAAHVGIARLATPGDQHDDGAICGSSSTVGRYNRFSKNTLIYNHAVLSNEA